MISMAHSPKISENGGEMKQPQKWRETIDPFSLSFNHFEISEILGYPHAGNDVFYLSGIRDGEPLRAFLKVERQTGANIENEVQIISQLPFPFVPKILDYSLASPRFIVTEELPGERLSMILGENKNQPSLKYMFDYGRTLAGFHKLDIVCEPVRDRKFFHPLPMAFYQEHDLLVIHNYLKTHPPNEEKRCFVHGDFHYANILWQDEKISAVLDYELAGMGMKEFDLAWACFLRPGQKFLDTREEIERFLEGYQSESEFSRKNFIYYFLLIAGWFYKMGANEPGYPEKVRVLIRAMLE